MINKCNIICSIISICACVPVIGAQRNTDNHLACKGLQYCNRQIAHTLDELRGDSTVNYTLYPRSIDKDMHHWKLVKGTREEWCSGFWPGILWYAYENGKSKSTRREAEQYTAPLSFLSERPAYDHDLGFIINTSFGNGYRLTHAQQYKDVLLRTADTLATLYNTRVGTILSWPRECKPRNWPHNTIMDNMINLELLFFASHNGGGKRLYDMAVSHAEKTMKYNFRPDFTSYHVAVYDTIDGHFIKGVTHQGYSDRSMWARGQAWGIYGFTMVYRFTRDKRFLDFAQRISDVYLSRLPSDYIPYWDFDDPAIPQAPRDVSAACVVASGLIELSTYLPADKAKRYHDAAVKMLRSLGSSKYQSRDSNPSFLLHSTGNKPAGYEIDASIIYADYYYIEALTRLKRISNGEKCIPD